jgi:trimethylamine:corrinoid methyltransferase-like protein
MGAKVTAHEDKIDEVKALDELNPTDRCLCSLMAVMHYQRWYWNADASHAAEARSIAQHMLKHYLLSVLDPCTEVNLWEYLTQST